ncbi:MAG: hypothetical protein AAGF24_02155 [Cyanobacteria bacterium P01_H01_bin.121]
MTSSTQRLERLYSQNSISVKQSITTSFQNVLSHVKADVVGLLQHPSELRVWSTVDPFGRKLWNAYDPVTRQSITRLSENKMRVWIESRYA